MASAIQNRIMEESEGPVLCLEVTQKVTLDFYKSKYIPALDEIYLKHGEVRVLYYYPDPDNFPGWDEDAASVDIKRFTKHGRKAKKIATIDAPEKVKQRWQLISPLLGGPVREFEKGQLEEALAWIKA